jgi:hypothetical protein
MQNKCASAFEIYTGNNKTMTLRFVSSNGDPFDLSSCTALDVALPNADGSTAHFTIAGGAVTLPDPKVLGKANVAISSVASALLNPGEFQDFSATLTVGTDVFTVPFNGALTVRVP